MDAKKEQNTNVTPRPPIVVVLGHIDHGKTTLLDFIRDTHVAAKESGSITQHIGAYETEHNGKRITFLDTPGHESFSRMRLRGARVADIAVLVVAADDGVKPQTVEAIHATREAGIPFLVAINKIDKPGADANRVKGDLAEHEVLVEGWGGTVPVAEISARMGQGVPELLDLILLVAELEELTASPDAPGSGIVIESNHDRQRGVVATLLITNGTIHKGNWLSSGNVTGVVRSMKNSNGEPIEQATFSSPVWILGFPDAPMVGDTFMVCPTKKIAEEAGTHPPATLPTNSRFSGTPVSAFTVPLVIKADVAGSCEALEGEIKKLDIPPLNIRLIRSGIGDISEDDIKAVAGIGQALVMGFRVKILSSAAVIAARYGVVIHTADIIYELLDWVRQELMKRVPVQMERTDEGTLKVLKIFKRDGKKCVFGGVVTAGIVRSGALFDVTRAGTVVTSGIVTNLQQHKVDTKEVRAGLECGLAANAEGKLEEGDVIATYSQREAEKKHGSSQ